MCSSGLFRNCMSSPNLTIIRLKMTKPLESCMDFRGFIDMPFFCFVIPLGFKPKTFRTGI